MTDSKTLSNSNTENQTSFHDFDAEDEPFSFSNYRAEDWLAFVLFWLLALTVFSQFISRYVFDSPLGWTEEIARYQLVCLGFIGSCIGVRNNTHIFVSLFHRWLPEKMSHNIYVFVALCNVVFFALLAFFAWQIIPLISIHKMASLPISVSVLYGLIFGSLLILVFRSLQYFIQVLRSSTPVNPDDVFTSCD